MAQKENNIINSWSFKQFFMENGKKIQRVPCTNRETNESFSMIAIGATEDSRKFVGFSKSLGELSNAEINSMKNDLKVVELKVESEVAALRKEKGQQVETYRLCRQGESTWEDVEVDDDWA